MNYLLSFILFCTLFSCANLQKKNQQTLLDTHDFMRDFPTYSSDSLVNVVVEIPAGCNQKWETNKETGHLEWERINKDSLRIVDYLPYPANYGFIPQTLSDPASGGDGDPLDVFLLGNKRERGEVVPAKILGAIEILDGGERDDKLIAVSASTHWGDLNTLSELEQYYPGVLTILTTWLINYKGTGTVEILSIKEGNALPPL